MIIIIVDIVKVVLNQELDRDQGLDHQDINHQHIKNLNNDQDHVHDRLRGVIKRKQNIKNKIN